MKKTMRIFSVSLAVLLLIMAMPLSVIAKTLTTPGYTLNSTATHWVPNPESNLLLDIDNLADTTNAAEGSNYTYTTEGAIIQNDTERPEGDTVVTDYNGNGQWQTFIGHTNLPLTATSKYTISFDGKMIADFNYGGFCFTAPGAIGEQSAYRTTQGVYFAYGDCNGSGEAYVATGMNWWEEVTANRQVSIGDVNVKEQHSYLITINGLDVSLYIDGQAMGTMPLPADYWGLGTYISLGVRSRANTAGANSEVAVMKNIKIYDGGVVEQPVNELLLDIDNLADNTNAVANSTYSYTSGNAQIQYDKEYVDGDTLRVSEGLGGGQWASFVGHTNLPLTATSKYIITFDAKMIADFNYGGFVFSAPGAKGDVTANNTTYGVYLGYREQQAYLAPGMKWWEEVSSSNQISYGSSVNVKELQSYIITIDGFSVTFYINSQKIGVMTLPSDYYGLNDCLALGVRSRCDTSEANQAFAEMKNIKVYSGELQYTNVNNYRDGDVLLKVPTVMSTEGCTTDFEDVTVSKPVRNQNALNGEIANALYPDPSLKDTEYADGNEWMWAGVQTTLPLDADSKYTIDFYMKKEQTANIGFCITGEWWRESQGFYLYDNSFTTVAEYSSNYYSSGMSFSNIWTAYSDNDGFTRFTMEIDGYKWTLYIGGVYAGSVTIGATEKFPNVYAENKLSLAVKVYSDAISNWDLTKPIVYVKDITVYGGNVATNKNIQFVKDGTVLKHVYAQTDDVIEAFPEVDVNENETAVWFYKGTNIVATAPYTVHNDATLEVRIFDNSYSKVVAMQHTEATNANTQSVRFIATLQSLQGSEAGFEVTAKYLEGGVLKEKTWVVKATHVYSKINATENGTVVAVTAAELGGTYLCALSVDDVPTNIGQVDFYVKSYVVINGEKVYSEEAIGTIVNGVADTEAAPLTQAN
ncbi:MAG: hypothetical protein IJZ80_03375 [Clostridia bacterium]|nr:hypothetical protein [Clostridia bacterium]